MRNLVEQIDRLLPQTQCSQCGHPGCLPYAEAIVNGAPIDRCPPGGSDTVRALAQLLGRTEACVAPDLPPHPGPTVVVIDETRCIGCARCLPVCPVDAIVGAAKWMHTVVAERCTGCGLCLPPCPVDCIEVVAVPSQEASRQRERAAVAREHHRAHQRRAVAAGRAAEQRRRARRDARRPDEA